MVWWIVLVFALAGQAEAGEISGMVRVSDGDTLRVDGQAVRLHGIDAPEQDQMCGGAGIPVWPCGAWVTQETRARYAGRMAHCTIVDTDRYGRLVARCQIGGIDIAQQLVADGMAFAFRHYADTYVMDEQAAARAGRGLHGFAITSPADFRAARRRARAALWRASAPDGCTIKGNVSGNGRRIYHLPGQSWYDRTRIDAARGERWFCSEADARRAGWKKARR